MVFRGLPRACWEFFFTFAWLGQTPAQSQDWNGRQTWDSDRRVTVNNIQVTSAARLPRHKVQAGTPGILKYRDVIRSRKYVIRSIFGGESSCQIRTVS